MPIEYRHLTKNELDTFIEMRINQLREESAKEDIDLRPALKAYYLRHLADGIFVSWLAFDGEKIVGTSGRIALLSSVFTNPSYRRKGIAKELLNRVVKEAKDYGCGIVQITASDMGVKLYTDFGFVHNKNSMQYKL